LSNAFINQEHEILVTADLLDVCWQHNGGAGGGGLDGFDGMVSETAVSSGTCVSDCACDKIVFVLFSLMLCTFNPRPSTSFDSCHNTTLLLA